MAHIYLLAGISICTFIIFFSSSTLTQAFYQSSHQHGLFTGTLVCTDQGNVPVEQITSQHFVWAYDEKTGNDILTPATNAFLVHTSATGIQIQRFAASGELGGGGVDIQTSSSRAVLSASHPVYVQRMNESYLTFQWWNIEECVTLASSSMSQCQFKSLLGAASSESNHTMYWSVEVVQMPAYAGFYNFNVPRYFNYYIVVDRTTVLVHNPPKRKKFRSSAYSPNMAIIEFDEKEKENYDPNLPNENIPSRSPSRVLEPQEPRKSSAYEPPKSSSASSSAYSPALASPLLPSSAYPREPSTFKSSKFSPGSPKSPTSFPSAAAFPSSLSLAPSPSANDGGLGIDDMIKLFPLLKSAFGSNAAFVEASLKNRISANVQSSFEEAIQLQSSFEEAIQLVRTNMVECAEVSSLAFSALSNAATINHDATISSMILLVEQTQRRGGLNPTSGNSQSSSSASAQSKDEKNDATEPAQPPDPFQDALEAFLQCLWLFTWPSTALDGLDVIDDAFADTVDLVQKRAVYKESEMKSDGAENKKDFRKEIKDEEEGNDDGNPDKTDNVYIGCVGGGINQQQVAQNDEQKIPDFCSSISPESIQNIDSYLKQILIPRVEITMKTFNTQGLKNNQATLVKAVTVEEKQVTEQMDREASPTQDEKTSSSSSELSAEKRVRTAISLPHPKVIRAGNPLNACKWTDEMTNVIGSDCCQKWYSGDKSSNTLVAKKDDSQVKSWTPKGGIDSGKPFVYNKHPLYLQTLWNNFINVGGKNNPWEPVHLSALRQAFRESRYSYATSLVADKPPHPLPTQAPAQSIDPSTGEPIPFTSFEAHCYKNMDGVQIVNMGAKYCLDKYGRVVTFQCVIPAGQATVAGVAGIPGCFQLRGVKGSGRFSDPNTVFNGANTFQLAKGNAYTYTTYTGVSGSSYLDTLKTSEAIKPSKLKRMKFFDVDVLPPIQKYTQLFSRRFDGNGDPIHWPDQAGHLVAPRFSAYLSYQSNTDPINFLPMSPMMNNGRVSPQPSTTTFFPSGNWGQAEDILYKAAKTEVLEQAYQFKKDTAAGDLCFQGFQGDFFYDNLDFKKDTKYNFKNGVDKTNAYSQGAISKNAKGYPADTDTYYLRSQFYRPAAYAFKILTKDSSCFNDAKFSQVTIPTFEFCGLNI